MKHRLLCGIVGLSIFLSAGIAYAQTAPSVDLRMGATHPDVVLLQRLLNQDPDTRVAATGAGSSGMETQYFGAKTLDAVKRFQAKHRAEVLAPAGLTEPTGFVGPLTRKALGAAQAPAAASGTGAPSAAATSSASSPSSVVTLDPYNLKANREAYIDAIVDAQVHNGVPAETVALIEQEARAITQKSDYEKTFFEEQQKAYQQRTSALKSSRLSAFFTPVLSVLEDVFVTKTAHAALTGLPFGGYVMYATPICTCTPAVIQVFIGLPSANATSNFTLNYVYGTQAFSWYTLPMPGIATLGEYAPGVQSCYMFVGKGCLPIYARGQITPLTGSALSPGI